MAPSLNGYTNGSARHLPNDPSEKAARFSDIPSILDIHVSGADAEEAVEISLENLLDDPTELCTLLENENAEKRTWMVIALAYAKQKKEDMAIDILQKALSSLSRGNPKEKLGPLSLLCWMYLGKSRDAPRVFTGSRTDDEGREVKTKDHWLQQATGILNDASRVNPSFPPLYLARGVLYLLRASLQPPSKPAAPGSIDSSERMESLRHAQKCFEDSAKVSSGRNMMAVMGMARAQYSMGRYADALGKFQEVLSKMPQFSDPDPRIGVGCCLWQLGYRDEAKESWDRAVELNPKSKIALILSGLFHLNESSHYNHKDPEFATLWSKTMQYTQNAYKLDKDNPLTCATFGQYFLLKRSWSQVETLARKAIELTDVNAIASDGWYLLARKEHYQEHPDLTKINDYYGRADAARGGGDRGYIPARFGIAQVQVMLQDVDGAKFRLEKIIQNSKSTEAMMLLGALYAEDVFANQSNVLGGDKVAEARKAIALLESVRMAWKDPQKKLTPDLSVLVYLARLYEVEQPEKALQCLQQVEKLNIEEMLEKEDRPKGEEPDEAQLASKREELSPQLLNNLGCFQYQYERFDQARDLLQTALNACVRIRDLDDTIDTDALVTTISYNLARTYEANGLLDEAKQVYEGLLERHNDYTDARMRHAYIELRQNPTEDGPQAIAALNETDGSNLEVRALLGWYLSRSKKRATNIADDQEQKHYKKTLLDYDKHDRYALTGMGNLYATYAREMRRTTDKDKEKRSSEYHRAVGYYDKVLQLDPKNAYAAQGIGISLVEDRRDLAGAVQIFSKIRDAIRDSSVYINLGHVFCELKQYSRSIENYEAALNKDRASDPQVLACLGRVYLLKGKQDKSPSAMKSSLDYSRRALAIAPSQIHFKFNIAFVQIQLAQLIHALPESQRSLLDVQSAAEGLDDAIESFIEIARAPNPPYPKHDIEQRANMGRNTMRKQLERDLQQQREFEEKNSTRLEEARKAREVAKQRADEEKKKAEAIAAQKRRELAESRNEILKLSRDLAEKRAEEDRRREELEYTTDEETGERVKRKKKSRAAGSGGKRKKKGEDSDTGSNGEEESAPRARKKKSRRSATESSAPTTGDESKPKKRRKLARRSELNSKYKSSELVGDSDEEDDIAPPVTTALANGDMANGDGSDAEMADAASPAPQRTNGTRINDDGDDEDDDVEDNEAITSRRHANPSRRRQRIAESDDDEEDEEYDEGVPARTTAEQAADADEGRKKNGLNAFADRPDLSMVDEGVTAAGDGKSGEMGGAGMGFQGEIA